MEDCSLDITEDYSESTRKFLFIVFPELSVMVKLWGPLPGRRAN